MSLRIKLDEIKANSAAKFPAEIRAVMSGATEDLRRSGIAERALKIGDTAPSFALRNVDGVAVSSAMLLDRAPLVVSFYRGVW